MHHIYVTYAIGRRDEDGPVSNLYDTIAIKGSVIASTVNTYDEREIWLVCHISFEWIKCPHALQIQPWWWGFGDWLTRGLG